MSVIEKTEKGLEHLISFSRWLLIPMYLGLIVAEGIYAYKFMTEIYALCSKMHEITEADLLLSVLGLVDISMIANLIVMITVGGYSIFVYDISRNGGNKPRWLNNISSGTLKIKMGGSLVGVTSIHLLKTFINIEQTNTRDVIMQASIHVLFIISILAMACVERLVHPGGKPHETDTPPSNPHH